MKKIVLSLLCSAICVISFAQTTPTLKQVVNAGSTAYKAMFYNGNYHGAATNFWVPDKKYVDSIVPIISPKFDSTHCWTKLYTDSVVACSPLVLTGTTIALNGTVTGTGVSASSSANTLVLRDGNGNSFSNNFISSLTTYTANGGIVTLTPSGARLSIITGTTTATFRMPNGNASGMNNGSTWEFNNNSTGVVTIQDHSGGAICSVTSGGYVRVVLTDNSTSNGTWDKHFLMPANANYGTSGMDVTGMLSVNTKNVLIRDSVPLKTFSTYGVISSNDFTSAHYSTGGSCVATFTNSTIQISGGTGSGNDFLQFDNYITALENYYVKVKYVITNTISATSFGLGCGTQSINSTSSKFNMWGYVKTDNSSQKGGQFIFGVTAGLSLLPQTTNTTTLLSVSVGDTIEQTFIRYRNNFYFSARNLTAGGTQYSISYTGDQYNYPMPTNAALVNNRSKFCLIAVGGTQTVYKIEFGSYERKNASICLIGDSRLVGNYNGNISNTLKMCLTQNPDDVVLLAGNSDKTVEAVKCTTEVINLAPKYALIALGFNDIAVGISSATWQANLTAMYNTFTGAGINTYFAIEGSSDATNSSALYTWITANYPNNYIDWYTDFITANNKMIDQFNAGDGVHYNVFGILKQKEKTISKLGKIFTSIR